LLPRVGDNDGAAFLFLLPNSLPNSIDITQLPPGCFLPTGVLATSKAFNLIFRQQIFQNAADQIHADVLAPVMKFGHAERTKTAVNGVKKKTRFLTLGTLKPAEALLEFPIGHLDGRKQVIDVRPRIVFALMPVLGTLRQGFVIAFLVLFDETLQAYIATDLEPQMVALYEMIASDHADYQRTGFIDCFCRNFEQIGIIP
jgi:hypothetical protein